MKRASTERSREDYERFYREEGEEVGRIKEIKKRE